MGEEKKMIFFMQDPSIFLNCYELIICCEFGYDDISPLCAARWMKNNQ